MHVLSDFRWHIKMYWFYPRLLLRQCIFFAILWIKFLLKQLGYFLPGKLIIWNDRVVKLRAWGANFWTSNFCNIWIDTSFNVVFWNFYKNIDYPSRIISANVKHLMFKEKRTIIKKSQKLFISIKSRKLQNDFTRMTCLEVAVCMRVVVWTIMRIWIIMIWIIIILLRH